MTQKALDLLSVNNTNGFFLRVERASIDKQDHATNACGQIGETVAFDRAVGLALDYQTVWGIGPGAIQVLGTNDHTDLFDVLRG